MAGKENEDKRENQSESKQKAENEIDKMNEGSQNNLTNENQEDKIKGQNPEPINKADNQKEEVKANLDVKFSQVADPKKEGDVKDNKIAQDKSNIDLNAKAAANMKVEENRIPGNQKAEEIEEEDVDTSILQKPKDINNAVEVQQKVNHSENKVSLNQKSEQKIDNNDKIQLNQKPLSGQEGAKKEEKIEEKKADGNKSIVDAHPEVIQQQAPIPVVENNSAGQQVDKNKPAIIDQKPQPKPEDSNKAPIDQNKEAKQEDSKNQDDKEGKKTPSKQFIDEKKEEFFKLIDFSTEKQEIENFRDNLQKYFVKENINGLLKPCSIDDGQEINSQDKIKGMLSKFYKSKKLLLDNDKTLEKYLEDFVNALNRLLEKHNYFSDYSETYGIIEDDFRRSAFNDGKIEKFKTREKESSIDNFKYKDENEKYKGEKIIVDIENKKYKKRHGFGYYNNRKINSSFCGIFDNDQYKKGFLVANPSSFFNGEFSSEQEIFNGLIVSRDEVVRSVYLMLGESNYKEKAFNGMFVNLQADSLSLFFGTLKDQAKNSKNSILMDFIIKDSKLDENNLKFKLLYGDFENDQPAITDKNNDFYIYENNSLFRLTQNTVFSVFSNHKEDDLICQGEIVQEALTGEAALFDSKNHIYYSGKMENGLYKGKGSIITFDWEDNPSKIIFIRGEFEQNEIKNAKVFYYTKKNAAEKFIEVENARLSTQFQLKFGKISFEDNEYYEGEFKDFHKHGKGKYIYVDRSSYDGDWKDDKKDGEGVYIDAKKREFRGTWVNDCIQK